MAVEGYGLGGYGTEEPYGSVEPAVAPGLPTDTTPPVVTNQDPAPGTPITPAQAVAFDATDDSGEFHCIFVSVRFAETGVEEVVHDGDNFTPLYAPGSTRVVIADGFRFNVSRFGGWPSAPTFRIFLTDPSGNEA